MAAMLARCRVHSTHAGAPPRLVRKARCLPLAARAGRGTSVACESSREDPSCAAEAAARQDTGRRRVLAGIALPLALLASPLAARAVAEAPATDLIEGTQRLAGLGIQALEVQLQQAASGEGEGGSAELQERRRRFGGGREGAGEGAGGSGRAAAWIKHRRPGCGYGHGCAQPPLRTSHAPIATSPPSILARRWAGARQPRARVLLPPSPPQPSPLFWAHPPTPPTTHHPAARRHHGAGPQQLLIHPRRAGRLRSHRAARGRQAGLWRRRRRRRIQLEQQRRRHTRPGRHRVRPGPRGRGGAAVCHFRRQRNLP
ncbi:MAG: hypothetical protein J3K34DRAFT_221504 [Monoraphidium minutum]|nr:MAG: hypothetical protein J3K34DRAFT_221504 [Monoraphidium minutum]